MLRLPDPSSIDDDRPLDQLGMDSLMAVDIRRRLESRLQVQLPHPGCSRCPRFACSPGTSSCKEAHHEKPIVPDPGAQTPPCRARAPSCTSSLPATRSAALDWFREHREALLSALSRFGAVHFRGFATDLRHFE
ncbi:MAG: acyl carrier protein [Polyangiaceae bacterium]